MLTAINFAQRSVDINGKLFITFDNTLEHNSET